MSKKYPYFEKMKGVIIYDNENNSAYTVEKQYRGRLLTYAEFLKLVRYIKNMLPKTVKEEVLYEK